MAAKPNMRFMPTSTGKVHVVQTKTLDKKYSKCTTVIKGHDEGKWGRKQGVTPQAAIDMDECAKCQTHDAARNYIVVNMTPEEKREEAKRKKEETLAKMSDRKGKRGHSTPKGKDRSTRPSGGGMKRRGPRQSKPETMMDKAKEHVELAKANGWEASLEETASNEVTVTATRDGETLRIIWQDGRTVFSRVTLKSGVEVKLRNSANWCRHAEGKSKIKSNYTPRGKTGKKAARQEDIDDDAPRKLPFKPEDDNDVIVESLLGKRITWRNGISGSLDTAVMPTKARNVRMSTHPKSHRKLISFHESQGWHKVHGEMLGGERTVYVDKILKVAGEDRKVVVNDGDEEESA